MTSSSQKPSTETIKERAAKFDAAHPASATPKPRAGEHVTFGYWPNVGYVTFLESAKTEHGTIDWESVIGVFASAEEAEAAADSGR